MVWDHAVGGSNPSTPTIKKGANMGLLGGTIKEGSWWLNSKSDPRWNVEGRSSYVGGLVMPSDCESKIEELKKELGEPPDDLEWGYMKD